MTDVPPLVRRMRTTEAAIARFADQPFAWGTVDCLRLTAFVLREMGHAPPLRQAGRYSPLLGAHRALKRTGFALRRITPALALPADILALPSGFEAMPALGVVLSQGRVLAFAPELGCAAPVVLLDSIHPLAAWSA